MEPRLTPSALIVSWLDSPPVEPLRSVLREHYGYNAIPLQLPEHNREQVLKRSLSNALITHSSMINPFILYLYGDSLRRQGQSRLLLVGIYRKNGGNSVFMDWLKLRQEYIDKLGFNILVILDCNHKIVQTMVDRYPILEDDMDPQSNSIVQVLVAPEFSKQNGTPFAHVLADTLREVTMSSSSATIDIRDFVAEVQRRLEPSSSTEIFSLRSTRENLMLTAFSHEEQVISEDIWHYPRISRNASNYVRVSVLPITWATVDGWDAESELQELTDVFEHHFDFTRRINEQIKWVGPKGLLILLYNGHAKRTNGGMILFGTSDDVQGVNWTQITHTLNIADCDVVHVLDCCDALSATKGSETVQSEIANEANLQTGDSEYHGKNETLAAGAREERVPAGKASSMKVFAEVLNEMAVKNIKITIHSWQQWIVAKVGRVRTQNGDLRYAEPHYKMNPLRYVEQSINLQIRQRRSTIYKGDLSPTLRLETREI
ncbi:unnamed protein product [Fusarium graminearum]|nr:unnamed protein product [Fusarium graminearum]